MDETVEIKLPGAAAARLRFMTHSVETAARRSGQRFPSERRGSAPRARVAPRPPGTEQHQKDDERGARWT
jgi:hypothetical protein